MNNRILSLTSVKAINSNQIIDQGNKEIKKEKHYQYEVRVKGVERI